MKLEVDILGQLIPNPATMAAQLCSVVVLFLLVKIFLWKPIQNYFSAREDKMQEDLAASAEAKNAALQDREEARSQLKSASDKADQIIEAAQKEAGLEKENILSVAVKEADAVKKKAHEQIEAERQGMYDSMKKEMVNVAMDAAARLIGEQNSLDMDRQAVEAFVKEAADHDE